MAALRSVRLNEVAELNPVLQSRPSDDELVSFLPMSAVDAGTVNAVDVETRRFHEVSKGYTPFVADDLLVAKITPCFENGKIVQAKPTCRFAFGSTEFHVVRPRSHVLDARFLVHFLRQECVRREGKRKMTGSAGQRRVPEHFLANLQIPFLPVAEQRRIAAILDKADALRAKRRAALTQLDSVTQSIFLDMFGDPTVNPIGWPVLQLVDCTDKIQIGPFGSLLHQRDYIAGGVPLVNPKHIQGGRIAVGDGESVTETKYSKLGPYHLETGDVVMGRRGEMGRCAIVGAGSGPLLCGTGSLYIRPDNVRTISLFVWATLTSASIKSKLERLSLGQTLPNLNAGIVERLQVPVAPIRLQREFEKRLAAVGVLSASQQMSDFHLSDLVACLQRRAFRGDL